AGRALRIPDPAALFGGLRRFPAVGQSRSPIVPRPPVRANYESLKKLGWQRELESRPRPACLQRLSHRTPSPAGRAGRGRGQMEPGVCPVELAAELLHRPGEPAGVGIPVRLAILEKNGDWLRVF